MELHSFQNLVIAGGVTAPEGFSACGIAAGIKKNGQQDLAIIKSTVLAAAAGVYTTNVVKAAPLQLNKQHLQNGQAQAIVVNSGNANACTGEHGMVAAQAMAATTAECLGIDQADVLVASTGVIGVAMPVDTVVAGIRTAAQQISTAGGTQAAKAIMTTDTVLKEVAVQFKLSERTVTLGAMAKGSGMIHPNMATMLGFVTTDAKISSKLLQKALSEVVSETFNMISVDGDTSTNDMVVMLANGLAGNEEIVEGTSDWQQFVAALAEVCTYLAKSIARDGEGATKLVEIRVLNAPTVEDARKAAMSINTSSLVKTAIFGEDANWGRILAAVGYSGANFDPDQVDIFLGDEQMAKAGVGLAFDEDKARGILQAELILITVDLKIGTHQAVAWGCDFSYDYVKINAAYRT